jgi:hypothetical protein
MIARGNLETSWVKFVGVSGSLGWGWWVERVGVPAKSRSVRPRVSIGWIRGLSIDGLVIGIFGLRWF